MRTIVALAFATLAWAQTPAARLHVSGVLVDSQTGEPVRRAAITLQLIHSGNGGQPNQTAMSDAGGRFEFAGLTGGVYQLMAERRGYPKQNFGSRAGFPVSADMPDITFRMRPYAVLAGAVVDENGDPIAGAVIHLIRSEIQAGRRELRPSISAVTDDRGEYRLASLERGRYYVSAFARAQEAGDSTIYARRFYAGSADLLNATFLDLESGSNQRIDFQLSPQPSFHIRGQVSGSEGIADLSVALAPSIAAEGFGGTGYAIRFSGEGHFEIAGVTAGQYVLTASGYKDGGRQIASQLMTVGSADLDGVTIAPGPVSEIAGHVTFEQKDSMKVPQIGIVFQPEETISKPSLAAQLRQDGGFELPQVLAGGYTVRVNVPEPYYLKLARSGGIDVLASPLTVTPGATTTLELVIASNGGEVSGSVHIQDKPAADCVVLLSRNGSSSPSQNKFVPTDANGKFIALAVAPGEYTAYAWRDISEVEYRNPQVLAGYSGELVTVTEGGKQTVDLKLNGN